MYLISKPQSILLDLALVDGCVITKKTVLVISDKLVFAQTTKRFNLDFHKNKLMTLLPYHALNIVLSLWWKKMQKN